jgi:hypothetical protein
MHVAIRFCVIPVLLVAALVAGCGTQQVHHDETFPAQTPYSRRIAGSAHVVCDSVKRALLNQGYLLEAQTDPATLVGTKAFQRGEDMVTLRLRTTCMDNNDATQTVFAAAQEEVSELQTLKQPAGVSVGGFGVTIPSGSARIPVMVKKETVQDPAFYGRFYRHVEELIGKLRKP